MMMRRSIFGISCVHLMARACRAWCPEEILKAFRLFDDDEPWRQPKPPATYASPD